MRNVLDTVSMDGIVVIGEGEKDEAPMLYNGERVGNGSNPLADVAVDPIDGTTLTAMGRGNAISVIAVSERGSMFNPGPCVYMEKIAVGPEAATAIDLNVSPTKNLKEVAKAMKKSLSELTVMILERDRHNDLIAEVRTTGARIRLISDGDIFGAIAAASTDVGVDVLIGIGDRVGRMHHRRRGGPAHEAVGAGAEEGERLGHLLFRSSPRNRGPSESRALRTGPRLMLIQAQTATPKDRLPAFAAMSGGLGLAP
jgi:hypothetical protein